MRAAPALQVDVLRFGIWRGSVGALITLAVGQMAVWAWWMAPALPPALRLTACAAALACAAAAASLLRSPGFRLRFDGAGWHVSGVQPGSPAWSGQLWPAIDLGFWMLLRFVPETAQPRCPHRWLAVQRPGLQPHWHGLRCAVYSARPNMPPRAELPPLRASNPTNEP